MQPRAYGGGGGFGRGEFCGDNLAVKKSGEIPPGEIFAACDQQFHCEIRYT